MEPVGRSIYHQARDRSVEMAWWGRIAVYQPLAACNSTAFSGVAEESVLRLDPAVRNHQTALGLLSVHGPNAAKRAVSE